MYTFLLTLLLLVGIVLTVVILLQSGKGGGLAAMGGASAGTDNLIGGRQAATLLTKATWTGGALFLGLALTLSVMSSRRSQPSSVLQGEFQQTAPAVPPPVLPGIDGGAAPATGTPEPAPATPPDGGATPQP